MNSVLEKINTPRDVKALSSAELTELAAEIRKTLIEKVNATGGHMGPNLGFIEATIALHRVFDSPTDKIVFDVSHQCYTHKILTGRRENFTNPAKYDDISGFTNPKESEHDFFQVGHTSTAASLAFGLAKARDIRHEKYNVIAVIGDGSLSGGEAFEGLDNAAELGSNFIAVINDNDMSIAENHGGMYRNLKALRDSNGTAENNFFKSLGFDYIYVGKGNDLNSLITAFEQVKDSARPVVVHLNTEKGLGLSVAETNKEAFHWIMPHTLDAKESTAAPTESFESLTTDFLVAKKQKDGNIVAITAGTPGAYGFTKDFREKMGDAYLDVGICEEHAVAAASGMAKNGIRPVFCVLSSFIQRTYDQLSQDLALNSNPATILVFWGGISNADATHLGYFDIPLISNIPNMVYLAPTTKEEYLAMLNWATTQQDHPVAVRVPFGAFVSTGTPDKTDYSDLNKFKVEIAGRDVAIIAAGNAFETGRATVAELKKSGIDATLINPRFLTGVDTALLDGLKQNHKVVATIENGLINGGFGEKITRFYGTSAVKVLNFGAHKEFTDRENLDTLKRRWHLTPDLIAADVLKTLNG